MGNPESVGYGPRGICDARGANTAGGRRPSPQCVQALERNVRGRETQRSIHDGAVRQCRKGEHAGDPVLIESCSPL
jgi:hypothetical protein